MIPALKNSYPMSGFIGPTINGTNEMITLCTRGWLMKSPLTDAISLEDHHWTTGEAQRGVLALKQCLCLLDAINALAILTVALPMELASRQLGSVSAGSHGLATTVRKKTFLPICALD
jgi:hypothetical protein